MKTKSTPAIKEKRPFRRPLGIMPIIAVTAALWGCNPTAAPAARAGHKNALAATTLSMAPTRGSSQE